MNTVEPYSIETTRERLDLALQVAKYFKSIERRQHSSPKIALAYNESEKGNKRNAEANEVLESHAEEMKAIYFTLRLRGVEEVDFPTKIEALTVDDIYVTVEPAGNDEVTVYTIAGEAKAAERQA